MRSTFELMGLDLEVPDHTTLSRRSRTLDIELRNCTPSDSLVLILDSSGLSIRGEGQWAAAKPGERGIRGWRKLHLGVDEYGVIVGHWITEATADDASNGVDLVGSVPGDIRCVIGDSAYDTNDLYEAAVRRGAQDLVPPVKTAKVRPLSFTNRDRTLLWIKAVGRQQWKTDVRVQLPGASRAHVLPVQADRRGQTPISAL